LPQFNRDAAGQVEVEQAHVAAMYRLLDERLTDARAQLADVLKSSADSAGEVYERDVAAEHLARRIRGLEGAEEGLAFGRVDGADGTVLHIGRLGLHVGDRDLPLLVDWRAERRGLSTRRRPSTPWGCAAGVICGSRVVRYVR
jgi:DNA helicase IV